MLKFKSSIWKWYRRNYNFPVSYWSSVYRIYSNFHKHYLFFDYEATKLLLDMRNIPIVNIVKARKHL